MQIGASRFSGGPDAFCASPSRRSLLANHLTITLYGSPSSSWAGAKAFFDEVGAIFTKAPFFVDFSVAVRNLLATRFASVVVDGGQDVPPLLFFGEVVHELVIMNQVFSAARCFAELNHRALRIAIQSLHIHQTYITVCSR